MKVCEVDDYSMCGIQRVLAPAWVSQRWQGGHYSQDSVRGQDGMIDRFIFPAHDSWFPPWWFPVAWLAKSKPCITWRSISHVLRTFLPLLGPVMPGAGFSAGGEGVNRQALFQPSWTRYLPGQDRHWRRNPCWTMGFTRVGSFVYYVHCRIPSTVSGISRYLINTRWMHK